MSTAQPRAPTEALVVLVGAHGHEPPVAALRRAVHDVGATPTVIAGIRLPLWWALCNAGAPELGAALAPGCVLDAVERALRAAVAGCPELDGVPIEVTTASLPRNVMQRVDAGRFRHLILLARPRHRRVVRQIVRRIAGRLPTDVYWL